MPPTLKESLYRGKILWQKWHRCPLRDRMLLVEAMGWLGLARVAVFCFPFKRITPYLGTRMNSTPQGLPAVWQKEAGRIRWAIRAAAPLTLWKSNCLVQGIAGKLMLRRRGIPSTLYLGMAKRRDAPAVVIGHAWLRCGTLVVTDPGDHERFTVIASYSDPELLQN